MIIPLRAMNLFLIPAAFLATVTAHLLAIRLFPALGLLDFPERYHLRRPRLPYPTGAIAVGVFLIAFPLLLPLHLREAGLLAAIGILGIVSFIDDRTPLPPWHRLTLQIALTALVFIAGLQIYTITNPFGGIIKLDAVTLTVDHFGPLPVASGIFTVTWLILTINAMNWHDGVPGQVTTMSSFGFLLLWGLALFRNHQPEVALLALLLSSISMGSALFDFPPPRTVLGDSGSMFFGLMLGVLGVYQGGKVATALLILGIPLFDALIVTVQRIARGHSPFRGEQDHLHDLLRARGWTDRSIVFLSTGSGVACGTIALFSNTAEKAVIALALFVFVLLLRRSVSRGLRAK